MQRYVEKPCILLCPKYACTQTIIELDLLKCASLFQFLGIALELGQTNKQTLKTVSTDSFKLSSFSQFFSRIVLVVVKIRMRTRSHYYIMSFFYRLDSVVPSSPTTSLLHLETIHLHGFHPIRLIFFLFFLTSSLHVQ